MEKKMFKTGRGLAILRVILLAIVIIAFLIGGIFFAKRDLQGEYIIESKTFGDFVYLDAIYASDIFGSDDSGNKYLFVTMLDKKYNLLHDYILSISEKDFKEIGLDKVVDATYSKKDKKVPPVHLTGYIQQSSDNLSKLAEKYYPKYVGNDSLDDPLDYLGNLCLVYSNDSVFTRIGIESWIMYFFIVIFIIMALIELLQVIRSQVRKERKISHCRKLYEESRDYARGISEIELSDTVFYKKLKCYVTPNYVVTYQDGLEVLPIREIKELYGYDNAKHNILAGLLLGFLASYRANHYLAAVTSDNELHLFANTMSVGKLHNQIVGQLIQKNPKILLGRNSLPAYDLEQDVNNLKLSKISGFYGNSNVWKGRVKETFIS